MMKKTCQHYLTAPRGPGPPERSSTGVIWEGDTQKRQKSYFIEFPPAFGRTGHLRGVGKIGSYINQRPRDTNMKTKQPACAVICGFYYILCNKMVSNIRSPSVRDRCLRPGIEDSRQFWQPNPRNNKSARPLHRKFALRSFIRFFCVFRLFRMFRFFPHF